MEQVVVSDGFTMYVGDVLDCLYAIPDQSVHMCVTSPPYWAMRDYGVVGQLGLEETPEEYVENLLEVFREVRRVMRDDATLWLNLGDGYAANRSYQVPDNKHTNVGNHMGATIPTGLKAKDLIGMPWRVAFALQADGWYLRSDIIWNKLNPMPSSVRDRPTTSHEYIFLLAKKATYFYDKIAIAEPAAWERWGTQFNPKHEGRGGGAGWIKTLTKRQIMEKIGPRHPRPDGVEASRGGGNQAEGTIPFDGRTRNKRTVWTFPTQSYKGSHYATFPEKLAEICIRAGSSALGCCPKCGNPWKRTVETKHYGDVANRDADRLGNGFVPSRGQKAWDAYVAPKTIGWEATCECAGYVCPTCDDVLDHGPRTKNVPGMLLAIYPEEERTRALLDSLPGKVCDEEQAQGRMEGAENVPRVRRSVSSDQGESVVLLADLFQPPQCENKGNDKGICEGSEGVHSSLSPRTSDVGKNRLRDGTPFRYGGTSREITPEGRGGSSFERDQGRQQHREFGSNETISTRSAAQAKTKADHLPPLQRSDASFQSCSICSAALVRVPFSPVPSVVLDCFLGSGTSAQVARSLGRKCIGIDLDRRNLDQAIERYNTPTREEKKSKIKTKARKPKVAQLSLDIE